MFDNNWENIIYKKNKQINKYPYDWIVSNTHRFITKKSKCLELGSGVGNNINFLLDFGFRNVDSLEASKTAVKIQRKKLIKKNVKIYNSDFNIFDYKKNNYNLVIDRVSLTHNKIHDIKNTIKKILISLKKDGYFFSIMFSKRSSFYKRQKQNSFFFQKEINNKKGILTNFFSKDDILELFKNFKIINLTHETRQTFVPNNKKLCNWNIICKKK